MRCERSRFGGIGELRPDPELLSRDGLERIAPLIEAIRENNLVVLTHASEPVGHHYPGKGRIVPEVLYPLITRFPDLTLVCAHWGGGLPFYSLMPEVKEALGNVYYDTAASPFLYRPDVYVHVTRLVGADRILFGSDYPLLHPGRLLAEIDSVPLTPEERQQVLAGNAGRLLGLTVE